MKQVLKFIWRWTKRLSIAFFLISIFWVIALKWINPPITILQIRENFKNEGKQLREWRDMDEIAPAMALAVVSSEDQNFMKHNGFDFGAIEKAVKFNEKNTKRTRGASTISQQTAKNVFLWPNRSWLRKGLEVYFTALIEFFWSKERILEVYLNVIETGTNTFGVQAASKKFFKKDAVKMSKSECALIAAAIPSPRKSNPGKPTAYLQKRKDHILRQMRLLGDGYFERYGGLD
jgi:monofunctional glycosyltransferase